MILTGPPRRSALRSLGIGLLGVVLPTFAESCQADTGAMLGGTFCTYQQTIDCVTDAGCMGKSICLPDLSAYGPCVCGDGGVRDASTTGSGGDASTGADH